MPRVATIPTCTTEQRNELQRLADSRAEEARLVERAKIILACLNGQQNKQIAANLSILPGTAGRWRQRFLASGLTGLHDAPRSGKPATYGPDLRQRLLAKLEEKPPAGQATWDGGSLALALGASDDAVWRVMRKEGIQLRRLRSWCVNTDPEFAPKSAEIIGLYLNPPACALVLSVDEKPTIQAIERATGYVQTMLIRLVDNRQIIP